MDIKRRPDHWNNGFKAIVRTENFDVRDLDESVCERGNTPSAYSTPSRAPFRADGGQRSI